MRITRSFPNAQRHQLVRNLRQRSPRAVTFYERSLALELKQELFGGLPMAIFRADDPAVGGALVQSPNRCPSTEGALVYLDVGKQLDAVLDRVPAAGGAVVLPKTDIGEPGFIALVRDTEGNVVGLHAPR
jgi:hypothetical protein